VNALHCHKPQDSSTACALTIANVDKSPRGVIDVERRLCSGRP
jgi:hypothetical protein